MNTAVLDPKKVESNSLSKIFSGDAKPITDSLSSISYELEDRREGYPAMKVVSFLWREEGGNIVEIVLPKDPIYYGHEAEVYNASCKGLELISRDLSTKFVDFIGAIMDENGCLRIEACDGGCNLECEMSAVKDILKEKLGEEFAELAHRLSNGMMNVEGGAVDIYSSYGGGFILSHDNPEDDRMNGNNSNRWLLCSHKV